MSDVDLTLAPGGAALSIKQAPVQLSVPTARVQLVAGVNGAALQIAASPVVLQISGARGPAGADGVSVPVSAYWTALLSQDGPYGFFEQWDLRYWANLAGVTLETGADIQPALDLAHAAMAAKSGSTMLNVYIPPGKYLFDQVKLYSSAGFYCDLYAVQLVQKPQTTPKPLVVYGDIDDTADEGSTASSCTLYGFMLNGQNPFSWLTPAVVTGSTSPTMPTSGQTLIINGQTITVGTITDLSQIVALINTGGGTATVTISGELLTLADFTPYEPGEFPIIGQTVDIPSVSATTEITGIKAAWNGTTGVYAITQTPPVTSAAATITGANVSNVTASVVGGALQLSYQGGAALTISGTALAPLGLVAGTTYGGVDETIPGLMHYATTERNGGDPDGNNIVGQAGVYLRGAFADAAYGTTPSISGNSPFAPHGDGDAGHRIGELWIVNVLGDGFLFQGTGVGIVDKIRVTGAGGRGIVLNAYDMHYGVLDAGGCGFEGLVVRGQASDCRIGPFKAWFCGLRANAGNVAAGGLAQDANHKVGAWFDGCQNTWASGEVQDSVASAFRLDACDGCHFDFNGNWVGLPPGQQVQDCGGIDVNPARYTTASSEAAGYIHAHIAPWGQTYTRIKWAIKATSKILGTDIALSQKLLPGDDTTDNIQDSWIQGAATVFGGYTPTLPAAGQDLVINGVTVTFGTVGAIADVAVAINAAAIPNVTASISGYDSLLTIVAEPPGTGSGLAPYFGTLSITGTAAAGFDFVGLSEDGETINSQSYFDRAPPRFHGVWWAPVAWRYNSSGSMGFGVNNFGALTGFISKSTGQVTMLAEGRGVYQSQITVFDPVTNTFPALLQGGVDEGGDVNIGVFGVTPAPQQGPAGIVAALSTPGGVNPIYADSKSNGGYGTTEYTFADVVKALKMNGWLKY